MSNYIPLFYIDIIIYPCHRWNHVSANLVYDTSFNSYHQIPAISGNKSYLIYMMAWYQLPDSMIAKPVQPNLIIFMIKFEQISLPIIYELVYRDRKNIKATLLLSPVLNVVCVIEAVSHLGTFPQSIILQLGDDGTIVTLMVMFSQWGGHYSLGYHYTCQDVYIYMAISWSHCHMPCQQVDCRVVHEYTDIVQCSAIITWSIFYDILKKGTSFLWVQSIKYVLPSSLQCFNQYHVITLGLRQNGRHFANTIFKVIFLNEKFCILIKISLIYVPKAPIDNKRI